MDKSGENVNNNELSLSDYIKTIYDGKLKVITITLFFGIIGTLYAFLSNEKWVTRVQILPASYNQNIDTFNFISLLKVGFENEDNLSKRLNKLQEPQYILSMFYNNFNGSINKENFFKDNNSFIKKNNNESELKTLINGISINKDKDDLVSITSTYKTKKGAYELLSRYSKYVDRRVNQIYYSELDSIINLRLKYLKKSIESNISLAKHIRNKDISAAEITEKIAESVNQIEPLKNFHTLNENSDIALGSKGLKEKIIQLKNENNMAVFNKNLVKLTNQYDFLSNAKNDKNDKVSQLITHEVSDSLIFNTNKVAPRKGIIIIMSLFLGFMLSLVVVIFQGKLTSEYTKSNL
ncbi:Wzz/FepE/Etk N-terminal domain-containing protein [Photobacterium kishitanii]|uniref:Wzz/FepE/Etk N-terminal domain-containing protein n=1 Tax=Photobacterium kishitanii TaxID=318456 RepID=UPI000B131E40|nr:Wzz/FepE/Etk N-terminal domain-containing protein [Photobacterium kishitanii]